MATLDHHAFQEVHEPCPFGCRAVLPVIAAVDAHDRVDRGVRRPCELGLPLLLAWGEARKAGHVSAGRTTGNGDEVAVTAVLVGVRARPRDGRLQIDDLARPAVTGACSVLHRQATRGLAAPGCRKPTRRPARRRALGQATRGLRAARRRATDPVRRRMGRRRGTRTAGVDRHCAMAYLHRRWTTVRPTPRRPR